MHHALTRLGLLLIAQQLLVVGSVPLDLDVGSLRRAAALEGDEDRLAGHEVLALLAGGDGAVGAQLVADLHTADGVAGLGRGAVRVLRGDDVEALGVDLLATHRDVDVVVTRGPAAGVLGAEGHHGLAVRHDLLVGADLRVARSGPIECHRGADRRLADHEGDEQWLAGGEVVPLLVAGDGAVGAELVPEGDLADGRLGLAGAHGAVAVSGGLVLGMAACRRERHRRGQAEDRPFERLHRQPP